MFKAEQLREFIIKPSLHDLVLYSEGAVELMMFTCAVESLGGTYLKQVKGPALGIYQMEPDTYNDIWQNFIKSKHSLMMMLLSNFQVTFMPPEDRIVYDLRFATAMTRIHYQRVLEAIPDASDVVGLWNYYKKHYNCLNGAAVKDEAIAKYYTFLKA